MSFHSAVLYHMRRQKATALVHGVTVDQQTVSGTYQIACSLCTPTHTNTTKVRLLTHGGGFDRSYWDFAANYSYVDIAVQAGYAVFLYDRLGVGLSEKPDPVNVVQFPLEIELGAALARALRNGAFGSIAFNTVIGVGHSLGSLMTLGINSQSPKAFDATVLTGLSTDSIGLPAFVASLNLAIAAEDDPHRFAGVDPGYVVTASTISNEQAFFHHPGFDPKLVVQVNERKGLSAYGEFLTQGISGKPALKYTGPVALVNGKQDLVSCNANCTAEAGIQTLKTLYPMARNLTPYIIDNTGHGISPHFSAGAAYKWVQEYLKRQGF